MMYGVSHDLPVFSGDFGKVSLVLNGNRFTRFEQSTFQDVLLQMASGIGKLYLFDSKLKPTYLKNENT